MACNLKSFKFWSIRFPEAGGSLWITTNGLRSSCSSFWVCFVSTFESALTCFSRICSTPLCDCSVNTELIRGMKSSVQLVDVATRPIVVDGVSIIFLEYSTAQRAHTLEYRLSWILKIFHHLVTHEDPTKIGCIFLIPLAFFSWPQSMPSVHRQNSKVYSLIFLDVRAQVSSSSPLSGTMSLNIDMKIIRTLKFSDVMFFACRSAWISWRM